MHFLSPLEVLVAAKGIMMGRVVCHLYYIVCESCTLTLLHGTAFAWLPCTTASTHSKTVHFVLAIYRGLL